LVIDQDQASVTLEEQLRDNQSFKTHRPGALTEIIPGRGTIASNGSSS
jgi:hypothetical protein